MFKGKKVIVVMPAYNAEQTLKMTYDEVMAQEMVDLVILVDDASSDQTSAIARGLLKTRVHIHEKNSGYGLKMLEDMSGHAGMRSYIENGYSVVTI